MNKNVSIIIPTFNRADFLVECIDSCLAQTQPCEIIVCDHGSTDTTPEVVKKYGDKSKTSSINPIFFGLWITFLWNDQDKKYINPILKSKNSNREKRVAFSKLPKPDCINCKRPVGTVFSVKNVSSDFVRKYIAKCGDATEPCPLNINIHKGTHFAFENEINKNAEYIDEYKKNIIKEKYDMMFGYVAEETAIHNFEKFSIELKDNKLHLSSILWYLLQVWTARIDGLHPQGLRLL